MFCRHEARHTVVDGIFGAGRIGVESKATVANLGGEFVSGRGPSNHGLLLLGRVVLWFVCDARGRGRRCLGNLAGRRLVVVVDGFLQALQCTVSGVRGGCEVVFEEGWQSYNLSHGVGPGFLCVCAALRENDEASDEAAEGQKVVAEERSGHRSGCRCRCRWQAETKGTKSLSMAGWASWANRQFNSCRRRNSEEREAWHVSSL